MDNSSLNSPNNAGFSIAFRIASCVLYLVLLIIAMVMNLFLLYVYIKVMILVGVNSSNPNCVTGRSGVCRRWVLKISLLLMF